MITTCRGQHHQGSLSSRRSDQCQIFRVMDLSWLVPSILYCQCVCVCVCVCVYVVYHGYFPKLQIDTPTRTYEIKGGMLAQLAVHVSTNHCYSLTHTHRLRRNHPKLDWCLKRNCQVIFTPSHKLALTNHPPTSPSLLFLLICTFFSSWFHCTHVGHFNLIWLPSHCLNVVSIVVDCYIEI
jgi:hypothetical protein